MPEFQPGGGVRVVIDATIVRLASGGLGFEIDQPGTFWHGSVYRLDGNDVRPAANSHVEYAVAHGLSEDEGAGPEDAAGYRVCDDEAEAFKEAQWFRDSGVFRRRVDFGAWEVAPDDA